MTDLRNVNLCACWLCHRADDGGGVLVDVDGAVRWMCSFCEDKTSPDLPLDMTEDEEFENREGQPEFNGAFR